MQDTDKELLIRFFHNKCNPEEIARATELLQQPGGAEFFRQLAASEWNEPVEIDEEVLLQHNQWKEKLNARIIASENSAASKTSFVQKLYRFRQAAIWLGILLVSAAVIWQLLRQTEPVQYASIEQINESGAPLRFVLPDSSELFLAAGSKITYPEKFSGATRDVSLEGEAFFDITPNANQPFIIHTGDIYTKVLGTSFRIISIKDQPIEVAVATGKVNVNRNGKSLATLTPGSRVTWYASEQKAVSGEVDVNRLISWKNGDLFFDHLTLEQIASELQKRFKVLIDITDADLKNNRVSGSFAANKTIEQVLKALAVAGKFSYQSHEKNSFRISQLK